MKLSGWFLKDREIFQFEVSALTDLGESVLGNSSNFEHSFAHI